MLMFMCLCVCVFGCAVWLKLARKRQFSVYRLRAELREELHSYTY